MEVREISAIKTGLHCPVLSDDELLKVTRSMKLHRDLGITQKSAWFLSHPIREAWVMTIRPHITSPVEVDETSCRRQGSEQARLQDLDSLAVAR